MVALSFFQDHGLNEALKLATDSFFDLSDWFAERWRAYAEREAT
jgi:hypothetical protein